MNQKSEIGQRKTELEHFGQIKTLSRLLKQPTCPPRSLFSVVSAPSVPSVLILVLLKFDRDHQ